MPSEPTLIYYPDDPMRHKPKSNALGQQTNCCLVEGKDDAWFMEWLLRDQMNLTAADTVIIPTEGKDRLDAVLGPLLNDRAFRPNGSVKNIAICFDADNDPAASQQKIETSAKKHFGLPALSTESIVADCRGRRLGVFLFPDNTNPGTLESLCFAMLEANGDDATRRLAREIRALAVPEKDREKRHMQIFLARADAELCRGVGGGCRNGVFPTTAAALAEVRNFFQTLFAPHTGIHDHA